MTNFKQAIRDGVGDLLADLASGAMSAKDAERELDVCKALCEPIACADIGHIAIVRRDGTVARSG
jgi:hypothetical protein